MIFVFCRFAPTQVIDVGSGKGYLSSFLSLRYGLRVYGIDSSSTNTHGAQERNRKLKKFSRVYQKHSKTAKAQGEATRTPQEDFTQIKTGTNGDGDVVCGRGAGIVPQEEQKVVISLSDLNIAVEQHSEPNPETEELFLCALAGDVMQTTPPRISPSQLSAEERERRKRENLERKALNRSEGASAVFSPLTSYVTAETELRELINELEVSRSKKPKVNVENRFIACQVVVEIGGQSYSSKALFPQQLLKLQVFHRVWSLHYCGERRAKCVARHHQ